MARIFLSLPLSWRRGLAKGMQGLSRKSQHSNPIIDIAPRALPVVMQEHHVACLIHGHTHQPCIHHWWQGDQHYNRIVLSDWQNRGNMLICSENSAKRLVYF